jgi:DNA-binding helix-hairpin-helix protein with protein kinase domain
MAESMFIVDSRKNRYELGRRLGEGGQGVVFEVRGSKLAAKLLRTRDGSQVRVLENQMHFLRSLDLAGIPIAQPEAVIVHPAPGYLMRLLADMIPMQDAMVPPPTKPGSNVRWYQESGGLRRRLRLCARAARAIALLHAKGLCYGDVSPHNVYVSQAVANDQIVLIDADNLRYASDPANRALFTPGYGAPEIVKGQSMASSLADAHALAVTVFRMLTLTHPLIGDMVEQGEPELEERALRGELPWIDDTNDRTNASSRGIPRARVMSEATERLAARAFGEGLVASTKRPSAAEWADVLEKAAMSCVRCKACEATFLRTAKACPWCGGARPGYLQGRIRLWDPSASEHKGGFILGPDRRDVVVASFVVTQAEGVVLDRRFVRDVPAQRASQPCLKLAFDGEWLSLTCQDPETTMQVHVPKDPPRTLGDRELKFRSPKIPDLAIHVGDPQGVHRVIDFRIELEHSA